jgi:S1-C subfamily serine protease
LGTGSLLSADGQILTNYHVVQGYQSVGVAFKPLSAAQSLSKADIRTATVVKVDPVVDLALLKVTTLPKGLKPITLGDLSEISVGSDVHAIGHPTGEMWTYTKGLVSQIRPAYEWQTEESDIRHRANVIQTQTPINPGNSGGPLISDRERLVGVNTFRSQGEGLNFAVSVDEVSRFLQSSSASRPQAPRVASAAGCEPRATKKQADRKRQGYVVWFDMDCDGKVDSMLLEPFDKSKPVQFWFDLDSDGNFRDVVLDLDRDGKWDRSLWDTKGDGHWHVVGIHEDGTLVPTRFEPYTG